MQVVNILLPTFKYVYLTVFFILLASFFYPVISRTSFDSTIFGMFVLFIGLAGGVLLINTTTSKYPYIFLGLGFGLMGLSLYFIFVIAGKV